MPSQVLERHPGLDFGVDAVELMGGANGRNVDEFGREETDADENQTDGPKPAT